MTRALLCTACLVVVEAEQVVMLLALRDHCLEDLATHRMRYVRACDIGVTFEAIMRRSGPWSAELVG